MSAPFRQPDSQDFVQVGKVIKAHSIKGELKLLAYSGDPQDFKAFPRLLFVDEKTATSIEYQVVTCRPQAKFVIVKLTGLDDRTAAENMRGFEIWVAKDLMPELGDDEFYWHDLVGLAVSTEQGEDLGTVRSLFESGAADIMVIKGRGREYLVPAQDEFIASIDYDAGRLVIKDTPGLLDINS